MYKAADIRGTLAYTQIRRAIARLNVDDVDRALYQAQLVKRYLKNLNEQNPDGLWFIREGNLDELDIDNSFIWGDTPEGFGFWSQIQNDDIRPEELMRVLGQKRAARPQVERQEVLPAAPPRAKAPKAKAAPKQIGWWIV